MNVDDFKDDVERYARGGYVLATPLEFAMARPVSRYWSRDVICHLEDENRLSKSDLTLHHDCWHINVVVGELVTLLDWLPYHLPYISMERRGHFLIYDTIKLYEKAKSATATNSSTSSS